MASKYGMQLYGADLYSSAWALLEGGVVDFAVVSAGRFTRSQEVWGADTFTVGYQAWFTESETLEGSLTFNVLFSGEIRDWNNFVGSAPFTMTLVGLLFRAGERLFEGTLPVSVVPQGRLTDMWSAVADVTFEVLFDSDEYIGPFWEPDEPLEDGWVPDSAENGPWAPISEPPNWSG